MSPHVLVLLLVHLEFYLFVHSVHVDILTVIIGKNPMSGIQSSGPVIDVAFEKAAQLYPKIYTNISVYTIYKPNDISTCGATGDIMTVTAGDVFQYWKQATGYFLLLAPGCSLEVLSLGDMARELDVPLVTSTAADSRLADRHRYSTFVGFSSAGQSQMSAAFKIFLQRYNWKTVTLLCDIISTYAGAGTWYIITCAGFKIVMTEKEGQFQVYHETFDSTNATKEPDYKGMLLRAKKNSRIVILATNKNTTRKIMILAAELNMTSGDFVFLHPQAVHVPGVYDLDWQDLDANDQIAFEAFNSVVKIQFRSPNWSMLQEIENEITRRALTKYNTSYTSEEMNNDVALSAYEAVLATSRLLNENWNDLPRISGVEFSGKYLNRTFDMGFRTADISSYGLRLRNTEFCLFNATTGKFDVVWARFWKDGALKQLKPINWHGSSNLPPNEPLCGFLSNLCSEESNHSATIAVVCCVIIILLIGLLVGKKYWDYQERRSKWWLLNLNHLNQKKE